MPAEHIDPPNTEMAEASRSKPKGKTAVQLAEEAHQQQLQAIVDSAKVKNPDLYKREADLLSQLREVQTQIRETEGPDVVEARQALSGAKRTR